MWQTYVRLYPTVLTIDVVLHSLTFALWPRVIGEHAEPKMEKNMVVGAGSR